MTDQQLIEKLKQKDQKAFKTLIDNYQSLVLNTCYNFLHNKDNAKDITQEVFIEVYLSIHKFKNEAKLSTWLYRISVNKSLNFIRDNKKHQIVKNIENLFTQDEQNNSKLIIYNEQNDKNNDIKNKRLILLRQAIANLKKNQRIAFTLHKYENLSYKEISEIMNLTLSSVEGLIHRAKINIQKKLINSIKKK